MPLLPDTRAACEGESAPVRSANRRSTPQNHRLDGDLEVRLVEGPRWSEIPEQEWEELAAEASDPNVFFERWFLGPALSTFGIGRSVVLALVYRSSRRRDIPPGLVGLFPLERVGGWQGSSLRLFGHDYCFLKTPLLRQGHEALAWGTLLDWSAANSGADVLQLPLIRAEGPGAQALVSALHDRKMLSLTTDVHVRALLQRRDSAAAYIEQTLTAKYRHEAQRQSRRLAELGTLEFRRLQEREAEQWLQDFLRLEAGGWKGEAHTAFATLEAEREFFTQVFRAAAQNGRLQALGLWLNDQPIALKLNFLAGPGSFAFKIAYSEEFARYSPGVQLELENIRRLYEEPGLEWMDSCASPDHPMINRLWGERTIIQNVLISCGGPRGHLSLGLRPVLRAARRLLRRRPGARTATHSESRNSQ